MGNWLRFEFGSNSIYTTWLFKFISPIYRFLGILGRICLTPFQTVVNFFSTNWPGERTAIEFFNPFSGDTVHYGWSLNSKLADILADVFDVVLDILPDYFGNMPFIIALVIISFVFFLFVKLLSALL